MQNIAATGTIHLPNLAEFCNQVNGRAYIMEACQSGQHFRNWYLYITGFDQWANPIMLTLHIGECFIGDAGSAASIKLRLTETRCKVEDILREKDIAIFGGFLGNPEAKIIGEL